MDEILFHSSQKLENFQIRLSLATLHSKNFLRDYSQLTKNAIIEAWNGHHSIQIKTHFRELWQYFIATGRKLKELIWSRVDLQQLYYNLVRVFWQKWSKRDVCFLCAGFICGTIAGAVLFVSVKKKNTVIRYMQAVQCINYLGVESAAVVENAEAPNGCNENEVIISVKAASVHAIDAEICSGYGHTLRRILQRLYSNKKSKTGLPITLGRDCTGVITDIGTNVSRLEVGDEIWAAVPFWHEGTISQSVIISEHRIGRKPRNIGFEGACSLPYAGSVALCVLKQIGIFEENAKDKRILVIGGCTPVGCILTQILNYWKSSITVTCTKRASPVAKALGAKEIINYETQDLENYEPSQDILSNKTLYKELKLREKFDFIIVTNKSALNFEKLQLCSKNKKILGTSLNDFDEAHLCYVTLDDIANFVDQGVIQTVVDKVFHPPDIEIALNHIQSGASIGSSVITFR